MSHLSPQVVNSWRPSLGLIFNCVFSEHLVLYLAAHNCPSSLFTARFTCYGKTLNGNQPSGRVSNEMRAFSLPLPPPQQSWCELPRKAPLPQVRGAGGPGLTASGFPPSPSEAKCFSPHYISNIRPFSVLQETSGGLIISRG